MKPPQPHWFFSSSNEFSQSPRSRYNWPSVRNLGIQRGDLRGVLPHFPVGPDLGKAEQRLLRLGASRIDIGQGDVPWVVLADPEGGLPGAIEAIREKAREFLPGR